MEFYHKVSVLSKEEFIETTNVTDNALRVVPEFEFVVAGQSIKLNSPKKRVVIRWYFFLENGTIVDYKGHKFVDNKNPQTLKNAIPEEIIRTAIEKFWEVSGLER